MKIIILLLAIVAFAAAGVTQCLEQNCVDEIAACEWDSTCIEIVRDCTSNKKCFDQAKDKMDWNCMTTCAGPKKNELCNKFIICGKTNCSNAVGITKILQNLQNY